MIIIFGTSFALWRIVLKQEDENKITSACLKIELTDESPINLMDAVPITDEEGKKLVPYHFTLTNTCTMNAKISINLEILDTTTFEDLNYIKTMLNDKEPELLNRKALTDKTIENATTSYKLKNSFLKAGDSKDFTLRLWMDEETPYDEAYMSKIFASKVTVTGDSYRGEIDTQAPVAKFTTIELEDGILIDASSSTDDKNIMTYYYSRDGVKWIESEEATYTFKSDDTINYGKGVEVVKQIAASRVNEVYVKVEDEMENESEVVIKTLKELSYDQTVDNNLRYIGTNPNNYVMFNNELWRIIGVMENTKSSEIDEGEPCLKLIKATPYSSAMKWHTSSGNGTNNWTTASIQSTLNGTYFDSIELNSKLMMKNAIWYLGAVANTVTPIQSYDNERGSGNVSMWNGYIGLMYPSDYGYATSGGANMARNTCISVPFHNNWYTNKCANTDWLFNANQQQWTITKGNGLTTVISIAKTGIISGMGTGNTYASYPTIYLKNEVKIVSGTGTSEDPFILSL